jgi:multicomponent K+:H+ antiporter subunit G
MTHLETVPLWAAVPIAALLVFGSSLALVGSFGLARIRSFYDRLHAPTLGTSWGVGAVNLASMALFTVLGSRLAVHEILIGVFVTLTMPVTLILLGRAALHRDRLERNPHLPPQALAPGRRAEQPAVPRAEGPGLSPSPRRRP